MAENGRRRSSAEGAEERASKRRKFVPLEAEGSAVGESAWRSADTELWLVKLPPGLDAAELNGKKCELSSGGASASASGGAVKASDGRRFSLSSSDGQKSQYLSAFVCNEEKRWVVGEPFAREVHVTERYDFASEAASCPKINVPVPMHVLGALKDRSGAAVGSSRAAAGGGAGSSAGSGRKRKKSKKEKQKKEKRKSGKDKKKRKSKDVG